MKKQTLGFTLVEMLIVVAIIAIIAGVAYPSYMETVRKSNRADAKTELMDVAQRLQRCYSTYGKYNPTGAKCTVYTQLSGSPGYIDSRGAGYYRITIANVTATTYTLTATAILEPQLKDTYNGCNIMTLDQKGTRLPDLCW